MTTTCSATIGQTPGPYGFVPIRCGQTVGIRLYTTTGDIRVGYCPREGHEASVRRRFPEKPELPEPDWFPEDQPHENHETFIRFCAECEREMELSYREAMATYPAERSIRESMAFAVEDRGVMRDEFHR